MAWTFFKGESRKIFKSQLNLDQNTWNRARGWALWKATFELYHIEDKNSVNAAKQQWIIQEVLRDE